jgi:hypothetical protein
MHRRPWRPGQPHPSPTAPRPALNRQKERDGSGLLVVSTPGSIPPEAVTHEAGGTRKRRGHPPRGNRQPPRTMLPTPLLAASRRRRKRRSAGEAEERRQACPPCRRKGEDKTGRDASGVFNFLSREEAWAREHSGNGQRVSLQTRLRGAFVTVVFGSNSRIFLRRRGSLYVQLVLPVSYIVMSVLHVGNAVMPDPQDGMQRSCDVGPDDGLMTFLSKKKHILRAHKKRINKTTRPSCSPTVSDCSSSGGKTKPANLTA